MKKIRNDGIKLMKRFAPDALQLSLLRKNMDKVFTLIVYPLSCNFWYIWVVKALVECFSGHCIVRGSA